MQLPRVPGGEVAGQIAAGHAYDKHVVAERQFPGIASRAAFAALIQAIIEHPAASRRLSNDRPAYWDEATWPPSAVSRSATATPS